MFRSCLSCALTSVLFLCCGCSDTNTRSAGAAGEADKQEQGEAVASTNEATKKRKFKFFYDVAIDGVKPGELARVWLPKPQTSHDQVIHEVKLVSPPKAEESVEEKFGNQLFYFEATANDQGQIPVLIQYVIERKEASIDNAETTSDDVAATFLAGSKLVPADGSILKEVYAEAIPKKESPFAIAEALYDKVDERMTYGKPEDKAWGRGDSFFACREGVGNCTDFHSMFISLARDLKVPAKFEIGFPLPPRDKATKGEIGGYHCWAKFAANGRWIGVDISEADKHPELKEYYFGNLTPDRVTFTTGRDLELAPKNDAGPVNFLVYPYVEVAGKPHTGLVKRFHFEDVE